MAHTVFGIAVVAALGLALGSLKVRGVGLGIAGVLFSGLIFGHFGMKLDDHVLEFAREFGLILFVYTIGMQVGPGFLASLRASGLPLNIMAAVIVLLGAAVTLGLHYFGNVPMAAAVGLFSGATTNTPALGAAQQALKSVPDIGPETYAMPGLGYAVAYPFGIMGIILTMLLVRAVFRIKLSQEGEAYKAQTAMGAKTLATLNLVVENANLSGLKISEIPGYAGLGVVISRLLRGTQLQVAKPDTVLKQGDVLLAVGPAARLEQLRVVVGSVSTLDLRQVQSGIVSRRVIVTQKAIVGHRVAELSVLAENAVAVTRITRSEIEISATPEQRLQYGDMVVVVGEADAIEVVAKALGNSVKQLNHTEVIPIFLGIALGVLFGSIPIALPNLPAPVKLGLAGGPLVVAIILSRIGKIGPLLWYMPINANFIVRELGIVLFLACVGLRSGQRFVETLVAGDGLYWMLLATLITLIPLLIVGFFARAVMKLNYNALCGLLSGSMTDPPALAFANTMAGSDAPAVAYATVYPLTMLLRVLSGQLLVLLFMI